MTLGLALVAAQSTIARGELMLFSGTPAGFGHALADERTGHKNIMFNHPDLSLSSWAAGGVEGYVAQSDFQRIWIGSTEPLTASGGQAPAVRAADGGLTDAFFLPHDENGNNFREFHSLSFNIDMLLNTPASAVIDIYDENDALIDSHTFTVGNGNNFLGIIALDDLSFARAELYTTGEMRRIAQLRAGFSGLPFSPQDVVVFATPEPNSVGLWLLLAIPAALVARSVRRVRTLNRRRA